jgi:transketolase
MRQAGLQEVYQLAKKDKRVVFIGSDLGHGTLTQMKEELPNQFFMEGISEQHLIGFAAGLAKQGFIPFVNTIATFFTRRANEQIAIDLALHQSHVILLASGGGMVYAPLGPTHTAIEDIATMSAIPGMRIACPADSLEMKEIVQTTIKEVGPWYVRFGKGGEPTITDESTKRIDHLKFFGDIDSPIIILTTGITLHAAIEFRSSNIRLAEKTCVVHVPILYNHYLETLVKQLHSARKVIVLEEHIPTGGLFTRLLHLANKFGIDARNFHQRSLPFGYSQHYGSQKEHLDHNGLNGKGVLQSLENSIWGIH